MKSSEFKQLIKESVREVFREEIKEILLEAVRTPKAVVQESTYRPENYNPNYPIFKVSEILVFIILYLKNILYIGMELLYVWVILSSSIIIFEKYLFNLF